MTFQAKYAGYCRAEDCNYGDRKIRVGDECDYVEDEIVHAECVDEKKDDTPLCGKCFTYHRGECL